MTINESTEIYSEAVRMIAEAMHPEKIYLFGSHAWGAPTPDSDVDLFVIVNNSNQPPYRRSRDAYRTLRGTRVPVEVVVRTREEVENSKTVVSSLTRKVLEQGKLVYG
jgi:predicted nucleotidyltransferase